MFVPFTCQAQSTQEQVVSSDFLRCEKLPMLFFESDWSGFQSVVISPRGSSAIQYYTYLLFLNSSSPSKYAVKKKAIAPAAMINSCILGLYE